MLFILLLNLLQFWLLEGLQFWLLCPLYMSPSFVIIHLLMGSTFMCMNFYSYFQVKQINQFRTAMYSSFCFSIKLPFKTQFPKGTDQFFFLQTSYIGDITYICNIYFYYLIFLFFRLFCHSLYSFLQSPFVKSNLHTNLMLLMSYLISMKFEVIKIPLYFFFLRAYNVYFILFSFCIYFFTLISLGWLICTASTY